MQSKRTRARICVGYVIAAAALSSFANAEFDPNKVYRESAAVAAKFPDPPVEIATPAFAPGKEDFTSHAELMAFIDALAKKTNALAVRFVGQSNEGRPIPLLVFARPALAVPALDSSKPTVLIIGQLHGDEPAGAEAGLALAARLAGGDLAPLLDRINVLIVPRANPDGAFHFIRGTKAAADLNRDHMLLSTPEGRALGRVFVDYEPHVVVDCHEFSVAQRWVEKFGGVQSQDAMIQYATVPNLPPALVDAAETLFRGPIRQALERENLSTTWYYTTTYDLADKRVSMGGVTPDTGRNVAGLRNAVSFLIESRGVQIGRAHYKRRVVTHMTALAAVLENAARNAEEVLALRRDTSREVAALAGRGDIVVLGAAKRALETLRLLDPETGQAKEVEVEWRSALDIEAKLTRPRPFAYMLPAAEWRAADHLRQLGIKVFRAAAHARLESQRYVATVVEESRKEDVRRNDDESVASVVKLTTALEPYVLQALPGYFYVPLDQPLANLAVAALEPESQSSLASNRILTLRSGRGDQPVVLPLYRLAKPLGAAVVPWLTK
jgi:hypothetical protein